ncbi:MAG: hypothetical protein V3S11_04550, partial [Elusimicrobiota bacterium]
MPEPMIERLDDLESRVLGEMDEFCDRFQRDVGDVRRQLSKAKREFERRAEELREKLVAGPINEDELRARMVMLEMDYGSRVRLAEEGWRMLKDSLEERFETEKVRLRNIVDDVREALAHGLDKPTFGSSKPAAGRSAEDRETIARLRKLVSATERKVIDKESEIEELRLDIVSLRMQSPKAGGEAEPVSGDATARRDVERLRKMLDEAERNISAREREVEVLKSESKTGGAKSAALPKLKEAIEFLRVSIKRVAAERDKARRELSELRQHPSGGSEAALLRQEIERLRKRVRGVEAERDLAKTAVEESEEAVADQKKRMKIMQKNLLAADAHRDRNLSEERAAWEVEKEALEQKAIDLTRELTTLKTLHEQGEHSWEATLTRQDALRMQEIFKLRAEIQKLKWGGEESGPEDTPRRPPPPPDEGDP